MKESKFKLPLTLSVKARNWRMFDQDSHDHDMEFKTIRQSVLDRDRNTCCGCGFKAAKWQEVHHIDDDHSNNKMSNLVTVCMFCHACQHIGLAGRNQEAILAFIPEISQAQLHHVVRSILYAKIWANTVFSRSASSPSAHDNLKVAKDVAAAATTLEAELQGRSAQAVELIGTSSPQELGDILSQFANLADRPELYAGRDKFLRGIRLLPLGRRIQDGVNKMPDIVASWSMNGGPYVGLVPTAWLKMAETLNAEIARS